MNLLPGLARIGLAGAPTGSSARVAEAIEEREEERDAAGEGPEVPTVVPERWRCDGPPTAEESAVLDDVTGLTRRCGPMRTRVTVTAKDRPGAGG